MEAATKPRPKKVFLSPPEQASEHSRFGKASGRVRFFIVGAIAGAVAASLAAWVLVPLPNGGGRVDAPSQAEISKVAKKEAKDEKTQLVKLSSNQAAAAGIEVSPVGGATLSHRITVPGTVVPDVDRLARVSVRLSGTIAELRKKLGDAVSKDEVIAVLESREVADARSEFLAARLADELQQELTQRDKELWDKRISNEQQYLKSRNAAAQSRMRLDIARQKLFALGLTEKEIAALHQEPEAKFGRLEVRSPLAGRVIERKVDLGAAVGRDNLETELFVVADLDVVSVELAVSPVDLSTIHEGQRVIIGARGVSEKAEGTIAYIGPVLDRETRSARVLAKLPNREGRWRLGSFVSATTAIEERPVLISAPLSAIQTIDGEKVVFVRTNEGFEKRTVVLGQSDGTMAEVVSGLAPGENIAVRNSFTLKAEYAKASVED